MRDGFSEREIVYRAEDLILRLRDVRSCRIITDEKGAISEIHVVASSDRSPKFIARDVETALKAELDLEIDYRKIGVVLMDPVGKDTETGTGEQPGERPLEERPFIDIGGEPVSTDGLVDERLAEAARETSPPEAAPPEAAPPEAAPPGAEETPARPYFERPAGPDPKEPAWSDDAGSGAVPEARPEAPPLPETAAAPLSGETAPAAAEPGLEFLEDSSRIGFRGLSVSMDEGSITAEVRLSCRGIEVKGCVDDGYGARPVVESIAGAAVNALVELLDEDFHLCLSEVRELEITGRKALVAVVDLIRERDSSSFSGCAFVGRDFGEAAVMAVLDAVNRPFGRWKSRREIHYRIR